MNVVELAGGVGGAKLAEGLAAHLDSDLTVIVNTADDLELHGLAIWPDHDTVAYTLAGLDDEERGWGLRDETWVVMEGLSRLGEDPWFRLGDRDLATHLWRTARLRAGLRPTEVALDLRARLGFAPTVLPMSDDPVRTLVHTDDGILEFQDYFVRRHQEPEVRAVGFKGVGSARATPEVEAAIDGAELIVIAPSNPIVSIDPILALAGLRDRLVAARRRGIPIVAVSPLVGGKALKGPADRMMASLGLRPDALGVAQHYRDIISGIVIDTADTHLAYDIPDLGIWEHVTDTIMGDDTGRARLAGDLLAAVRAETRT